MSDCSITVSDASSNWPEGVISVKLTMNPYLLSMAEEAAARNGIKLWEFINVALWEKMGKPGMEVMLDYAAQQEISEDDPKWKKRLKLTARHEVEVLAYKRTLKDESHLGPMNDDHSDNPENIERS